MSASLGAGSLLCRAANLANNAILRESKTLPRCLAQCDWRRWRRRTLKPANWHVKGTIDPWWSQRELTGENKRFVQEVFEDRYCPENRSPLKEEPWPRNVWTPITHRTGVLAMKLGVIPQWTTEGKKFFVTLLQVLDNHVINYATPEEFQLMRGFKEQWKGFGKVTVGALSMPHTNFSAEYCGMFEKAGVPPKRKLTRFLVTQDAAVQPGTPLTALHYRVGDFVDVQAKTIDQGFQGVVRRWGFKGGPASHGATKFQRRPGSIAGGGATGGRVWKGTKMPGHMGSDWKHMRGLKIWRINTKYNVLYVTGPNLPGPTHSYVRIMDCAFKKHRTDRGKWTTDPPPMPTYYPGDLEDIPEEIHAENIYNFTDTSIKFQET